MSDLMLGTVQSGGPGPLGQFGNQVVLDGASSAITVVPGWWNLFPGDRVIVQQIGGQAYVIQVLASYLPNSTSRADQWIAFPYEGYYVGYGSGQRDVAFQRNNGWVTMRGLVKLANAGGTEITLLPSGLRPSQIELFDITHSATGAAFDGSATVQVNPDGTVVLASNNVSVNGWASMAGIRFMADGS